MPNNLKVIIYPVSDIAATKAIFTKLLGVDPYVDSPYYVGFKIGETEIGIAHKDKSNGVLPYFDVSDIKATIKTLTESGLEVIQDAKDVGQGLLVASLKDKDGNMIGLRQQP